MACTNWRDFISRASERFKTFRFFSRGFVCYQCGAWFFWARTDEGAEAKSNKKLGSRGPVFANFRPIFFFFRALLLKIQSATTQSISWVRGSSSGVESSQSYLSITCQIRHKHENRKKCPPQTGSTYRIDPDRFCASCRNFELSKIELDGTTFWHSTKHC